MKKILKKSSIIALTLTFILLSNFNGVLFANEKTEDLKESRSIKNKIHIKTDDGNTQFIPFYFEEQGNGYVKLKPEFSLPNAKAASKFTLKMFDERNNLIHQVSTKDQSYSMDLVSSEISKINLKYGYSIQLINHLSARPETVKISDYIYSNYRNHDYSAGLPTNLSNEVVFRLTPEGLRTQPTNQVVSLSGVHKIHSVKNLNKIIKTSNNNVGVVDSSDNSVEASWDLVFNPNTGAYKFVNPDQTVYKKTLSWEKAYGDNVSTMLDIYESSTENWIIEDVGNSSKGIYKIRNYDDPNKILNLDADGVNISVAGDRNDDNQRFKLVRK